MGQTKYLMMMEVSQKQAYIFRSKKLANNVLASNIIRYLTSTDFLKSFGKEYFNEMDNLVYAGGGHTILIFDNLESARNLSKKVSKYVLEHFKQLEMYIKIMEYSSYPKDGTKVIKDLIEQLEMKKASKKASFCQGRFGIEKVDLKDKDNVSEFEQKISEGMRDKFCDVIEPYQFVKQFDELGGIKNDSNFIAVVHIDGNSMGKKVSEFDDKCKSDLFDEYRMKKREFSEKIDDNFQNALKEMMEKTKEWLDEKPERREQIGLKDDKFPIRSIIAAGDDICFVTEGKIGIEAAVSFMKSLYQSSEKEYTACAGVAIVHKKYPFYKAYELAEELCSSAKKQIAQIDDNVNLCAVDWHIEFGEVKGNLSEIRKQYCNEEEGQTIGRPYIVCGDQKDMDSDFAKRHRYEEWKSLMFDIQKEDSIARGKLKELRPLVNKSESEYLHYLDMKRMTECKERDRKQLFDAIEMIDTYMG